MPPGAVERAGGDEDDPAQPLGEHAVARHRDAGTAVHRDPPACGAHVGDELRRAASGSTSATRAARSIVNAGERGPQRRDLGRRRSARAARARRRRPRAARCAIAPSTATSAPGRTGTCTSASAAVSVRRGSSTHTRPPRGAVLADAADRIGERGAVAVGDDRVRADEDRHARARSGPTPDSASARRSRARRRRAPARCRR